LQGNYSALLADYDSLETTYNSLNQTYTLLQTEVNNLHQRENVLTAELNNTRNAMYVFIASTIALIALIFYIKKKKPEPYIVLRKETVALKPEQQQ
jgi:tetrahydromethanopterin S-methyltransferase subunit B